ncbi:hypothetical protein OGH69_02835 [Flavobacterium sp. MFBS3-15]|uniref:hypothetical protein n=1 Tax=Flavobacterium sp. MFBS3-15 TaxID=2989816 RepID=UPI0022356D08|nr:hypothetical protein [Flavobacterium sp. MFBS3-15]MCW4467888.1 hypothetical protein [Flavobacterium sp. MFBS3-15]
MKYSINLLILLLCAMQASAQTALQPSDRIWKTIELANNEMSKKIVAGDPASVSRSYTENAVIMPEHSEVRHGKSEIEEYYRLCLDSIDVTAYQKNIGELSNLGGELLEVGNFTQTFTRIGKARYVYEGKYLTLWKQDKKNNTVTKTAEIWGANASFDRAALPEIGKLSTIEYDFLSNTAFENELAERNGFIKKCVIERKGGEHATIFLPDAMYLTYYTPSLKGIAAITAYFTEHEKPGNVVIDNLDLRSGDIYGLNNGNIVIEHGYYTVDFTAGDYKGRVTGKSINIWKRDKKGILMLYRQMVNHD